MSVLQALLIALFCYLGALTTPWILGTTGGWYVISRPLVAGLICGAILGNVPAGILIGVAVQGVFIGLITPGGAVPADLSFVSYLGIPLALVAGATSDVAVSLAVGFGVIGVAAWQLLSVGNAAWAHLADRYAEAGNVGGIISINYLAQIGTFVLRFILPFFVLVLGANSAKGIIDFLNNSIPWFTTFLGVLGGALPAVGIAILLGQITSRWSMLVWFVLGWITFTYLKVPVVGIAVFGGILAVIYYLYISRIPQEA